MRRARFQALLRRGDDRIPREIRRASDGRPARRRRRARVRPARAGRDSRRRRLPHEPGGSAFGIPAIGSAPKPDHHARQEPGSIDREQHAVPIAAHHPVVAPEHPRQPCASPQPGPLRHRRTVTRRDQPWGQSTRKRRARSASASVPRPSPMTVGGVALAASSAADSSSARMPLAGLGAGQLGEDGVRGRDPIDEAGVLRLLREQHPAFAVAALHGGRGHVQPARDVLQRFGRRPDPPAPA